MNIPKIKEYEFISKLGCGSYSTVYKSIHKATRETYAIKCIDKSKLSRSSCDNLISEIRLLKRLKHKHIVEMKEFLWDEKNIYIVMEYCNAGDLLHYIKKHIALSEVACKIFLRQLAFALKYMRENEISHFDLKPQNLLLHCISNTIILKVADFGFAQHMKLGQENTSIKGTPLYMAPEILLKHRYTASADLWSIGIILYECLFGKAPYSSQTMKELCEKIKNNCKIEVPVNKKISPETEDLLSRLLKRDPDERISFDEFFQHEFLDLKHYPSEENQQKAIEIVTKAVEEDNKKNFKEAYNLYCEAIKYFVPLIIAEEDAAKKTALRTRTKSYLHRAEEIKNSFSNRTNDKSNNSNSKNVIQAALTPSLNYQQLYTLSSSSPGIKHALEIGRQAELYVYEKKYEIALENFKISLGNLMQLLSQEIPGIRRDLLCNQIKIWMEEAENLKTLLTAEHLEECEKEDLETKMQCLIQ